MSNPTQKPTFFPTVDVNFDDDDDYGNDDSTSAVVGAVVGGSIGCFLFTFGFIWCLIYYNTHYHRNDVRENQNMSIVPPPQVDGVTEFVSEPEPVMASVVETPSPFYPTAHVVPAASSTPSAPPIEMEMGTLSGPQVMRQDTADLPVASTVKKG